MTVKYAFHSGSYHDQSIEEVIKKVSQTGYDAVELNAEMLPWMEKEEPHIVPDMSEKRIETIKKSLKDNDLEVSALSAHIPLIDPAADKRNEAIEFSKNCIKIAKQLGATVVHGLSGKKPDVLSDEEAWSMLVESLEEIINFSEEQGIKYAFEPVVGMFINSGERLKILKEKIKTGTLYVNFDPSHLIVINDDIEGLIRHFDKDIVHVHFKDGKGPEEEFEFPPLGQGEVEFNEFVNTLKSIGYDGYLSIEYEAHMFGGYSQDIDQVSKDSLKFMKELA